MKFEKICSGPKNFSCPFKIQDLEAIKPCVNEMEEEMEKIRKMQSEVEKQMNLSTGSSSVLS